MKAQANSMARCTANVQTLVVDLAHTQNSRDQKCIALHPIARPSLHHIDRNGCGYLPDLPGLIMTLSSSYLIPLPL
jgi:hypothetical protein